MNLSLAVRLGRLPFRLVRLAVLLDRLAFRLAVRLAASLMQLHPFALCFLSSQVPP